MSKRKLWSIGILLMILIMPTAASAMHIMEGYLPPIWCVSWGALTIPFVLVGFSNIKKIIQENPRLKILLAMAGAFAFVLSALKIPSVSGSSSHPTGVGLGAILFGPTIMSVLGIIVLLFQALLLSHGGITTLGANTFSMAIVGPLSAYALYKLIQKLNGPNWLGIFAAAFIGDLMTYVTTSLQLALAFPDTTGGFIISFEKFLGIFAITQIPLAIIEGILTVIIYNALVEYGQAELKELDSLKVEKSL